MPEYADSVNSIIVYLVKAKKAYEERGNRERAVEMARYEQDLRAFVREYERLDDLTRPIPSYEGDDLSDLPKELRAELSISKTDNLEDQVATVINAAGGEADIDAILIYLYRKFKVIQTRRFMQNKLWRMTQKGLLYSVPGKKGHYTTTKPEFSEELDEDTPQETGTDLSPSFDIEDEIPF